MGKSDSKNGKRDDALTPTVTDFALSRKGVPREREVAAQAMRLIVAILADPSVEMSVQSLAQHSGLSQHAVVTAMASPEYRDLMDEAMRGRCASALAVALERTSGIIQNPNSQNKDVIAAHKTLVSHYQVLAKATPQHTEDQGEAALVQLYEKLGQKNRLRHLTDE